jgi:hypothetical protein
MIDTSAVGLLSGTAQQAALNPAVAVTDYGALLMVSGYCFNHENASPVIMLSCLVFSIHRRHEPCGCSARKG